MVASHQRDWDSEESRYTYEFGVGGKNFADYKEAEDAQIEILTKEGVCKPDTSRSHCLSRASPKLTQVSYFEA